LLVDSILALLRENKDILWASMIKQTMMRKRPDFTESYFGYSTFSKLLEDASKHKIVELKRDDRSRTYIIVGLGQGH
ncbi:MAG: OST-HTH/LOTUS domain-containing protein, partial [Candidatus Methylomirabilales bacterium]